MSSIGLRRAVSTKPVRIEALLANPLTTVALVLIALGLQASGHLNCDASWFITFAEKYLDGAVPYVDVTDPNPPAAFLSLAPAVLLARALHTPVEPIVGAMVFLFVLFALALSAIAFRYGQKRSREDWGLILNATVYLTLIAPASIFAEREQIALLAMMPMLAALAVEAEGGRVPLPLRLVAGLCGGVAVCFKPFFALALVLPAAALAYPRARSGR